MQTWHNIKVPAYARLSALRSAAIMHNEKRPPSTQRTWREMRQWGFHNWAAAHCTLSQGRNNGKPIWYSHHGPEFRHETTISAYSTIKHRGWYTDSDGSQGKAEGIIAALPHGRFIAGYIWHENDERVYFPDVFDDEDDAVRAADHHAEMFAEVEREYQDKWREAVRIDDELADEIRHFHVAFSARNGRARAEARPMALHYLRMIRRLRERRAAIDVET